MKRFLTLPLVLLAIFLGFSTQSQAADKPVIHLLSTPFGTGSYALGTAMESIVNKGNYGITIAHAETPGQAFNINKLEQDVAARKNTVCTASGGINWLAEHGKKPFPAKRTPLMLIGIYNTTALWLATQDSSIKTMADLKGKRIALGRVPQVIWGYETDALLHYGYDEEFYKSLKLQFVGTNEAATALVNGQVDAAVIGGYMDVVTGKFSPSPQTVEVLASGRNLTHLDWGKEAIEKTAAKDVPLFAAEVPANTVEGQKNPIWTGADFQGFFAHPEFPEELAYTMAKAMIENVEAFGNFHALGKLMSRQGLVTGYDVKQIHPGALRAYKEAGLIK